MKHLLLPLLLLSSFAQIFAAAAPKDEFLIHQLQDRRLYLPAADENPRLLGKGAYGLVVRVLHKGRARACKITHNEGGAFDSRNHNELKLLRDAFKHPNIVGCNDVVIRESPSGAIDCYMYLDPMATDLLKIIDSSNNLTYEHMSYFLWQLLKALKYIHSAGVLHADLKPANVFLNGNCDLKLGDFGLATRVPRPDKPKRNFSTYVTTRWYRAPELLESIVVAPILEDIVALERKYAKPHPGANLRYGKIKKKYTREAIATIAANLPLTPAIDMWSLGVIFAEMWQRKILFMGESSYDTLAKILQFNEDKAAILAQFPTPQGGVHSPEVRNRALDLLSRMLEIDPEKRITAEEALRHDFITQYETNAQPNDDEDIYRGPDVDTFFYDGPETWEDLRKAFCSAGAKKDDE